MGAGNVTIFTAQVLGIWKSRALSIEQRIKLRYNATCLCPSMEVNKEYIICGYEHAQLGLLVTQDSVVESYKKKFTNRIANWEKRILLAQRRKSRSKKRRSH